MRGLVLTRTVAPADARDGAAPPAPVMIVCVGGASSWHVYEYRSRGAVGAARLRTSWLTGSSSEETVLALGRSGVAVWIDHTVMTGFATCEGRLLAAQGDPANHG